MNTANGSSVSLFYGISDTKYLYFKVSRMAGVTVDLKIDIEIELQLCRIYLTGMMASKRDVLTRTDTHGITVSKMIASQEDFHRDARTDVLKEYECHIFRPYTAVNRAINMTKVVP